MPRLMTSSWTLHRALGPMYKASADDPTKFVPNSDKPGEIDLLDLPAKLSGLGIGELEVCHFHFPRVDKSYIAEFRAALKDADVKLFSVLIDDGDITHADEAARAQSVEWIKSWLEVTSEVGATHARVIAGKTDITLKGAATDDPTIQESAKHLRALSSFAKERSVQVITENFLALTKRPEHVLGILELCEGSVGLCCDYGNYKGDTKYDDLAAIMPHATSMHAKADYKEAGRMERADFEKCLDLSRQNAFEGPYSLIFDGPGSEWSSLEEIRDAVNARIA
ncbi:MAG: TIM barrel protein [Candidatus Poribacteria bacterium]|nr:TIM barrel protein [Candidatus Poribacteria bacterium]